MKSNESADNFYSLLGIDRRAGLDEIRKAYRRLVLEFHPDRNPNNPEAEEKFKRIVEAYQTISDPNQRVQYDLRLEAFDQVIREYAEGPPENLRDAPRRPTEPPRPRRKNRSEPSPRRAAGYADYDVFSREFEGRDLLVGTVLGSIALLWLRPYFTSLPNDETFGIWQYAWALGPVLWGPIGYGVGQFAKDAFSRFLTTLPEPPMAWEGFASLFPLIFSVLGAWLSVKAAELFSVTIASEGLIPVAICSGLGAALGSAFGRAFTGVAVRRSAKLFGVGVAAALGSVSAGLLSLCLLALGLKPPLDTVYFDALANGAVAAVMGAALGSAWGALRPPPT